MPPVLEEENMKSLLTLFIPIFNMLHEQVEAFPLETVLPKLICIAFALFLNLDSLYILLKLVKAKSLCTTILQLVVEEMPECQSLDKLFLHLREVVFLILQMAFDAQVFDELVLRVLNLEGAECLFGQSNEDVLA